MFAERYRLLSHLSSGGFAKVYRAVQLGVDRTVAIKILDPVQASENVDKRFELEAKLISQLKDPHTITMHEFGKEGDNFYMVFEYVDGRDLRSELQHGALEPERVRKILRQVLMALDEAHAMDVVHRDLKPSNIMIYDHLTREDCVKVLDFGIAKTVEQESSFHQDLTAEGMLVGTPRYMAPEQFGLGGLTAAADIYALGLVTLEMLTGVRPFESTSVQQIAEAKLHHDVRIPAHLPDDLGELLSMMLRRDPSERLADAASVLEKLGTTQRRRAPVHGGFPLGLDSTGTSRMSDITGISQIETAPRISAPTDTAPAPRRGWLVVLILAVIAAMVVLWLLFSGDAAPPDEPGTAPVPVDTPSTEVAPNVAEPDAARNPAASVELVTAVGSAKVSVESAIRAAPTRAAAPEKAPKKRQPPKKREPKKPDKPKPEKRFEPKPVD